MRVLRFVRNSLIPFFFVVCVCVCSWKGIFYRRLRLVSLFARRDCVPVEITANIYHDKMIVQLNSVYFPLKRMKDSVVFAVRSSSFLCRAHFFVRQLEVSRWTESLHSDLHLISTLSCARHTHTQKLSDKRADKNRSETRKREMQIPLFFPPLAR